MQLNDFALRLAEAVGDLPMGTKRMAIQDPTQKWFPYYAGYSLQFAESAIRSSSLERGATIFDPWNGSGTTTLAAVKNGFNAFGLDLNPYSVLVAKARLVNPDDARAIHGMALEISNSIEGFKIHRNDRLRKWLTPRLISEFREIERKVLSKLATLPDGTTLSLANEHFPPLAAFLLLALSHSAKASIPYRLTSNPTVFRKHGTRRNTLPSLGKSWLSTVVKMGCDLPNHNIHYGNITLKVGDSRVDLPQENSVDLVLTSPPYCTRLDYADAMNFELAAFGPKSEDDYQILRRKLMGAPLVRSNLAPIIPREWPNQIKSILHKIQCHPSKASNSYYLKTYVQYFDDAITSLQNVSKSLKRNGKAAIVLQSSYYKEIPIDLPSLYIEIAKSIGMNGLKAYEMPVRSIISSINPGTQKYRKNWAYIESVIVLGKE